MFFNALISTAYVILKSIICVKIQRINLKGLGIYAAYCCGIGEKRPICI